MTKKKALTGAIIVMVIWFAMWGFGYWYLSNQVNTASTRGFIEDSTVFLNSDDDFADRYGQLSNNVPISKAPTANADAASREYYMDFRCTTGKGEYNIRVYNTWDEANSTWLFRYEELPAG